MQKKTIWYCHHYAGAPSLGMSYRPYYLTKEFCEAGHHAFVISASEHHLLRKPTLQQETLKLKDIDGVPFVMLKTPQYKDFIIGRLKNIFTYVSHFFFNTKKIIELTGKPDVIIVSSGHPLHYPALSRVARKYKAKLLFEVRDLWPLSLTHLLGASRLNPFVLLLSWVQRRAYRHADGVVSLLDGAFPYMERRGLDKSRFHVIPNGTNAEFFHDHAVLPVAVYQLLEKLKAENKWLLGYAGALGKPNAMEHLIVALKSLAQMNPLIHCVIVGEGYLKPQLQAIATELQLTNVSFLDSLTKYEIPAFLYQMDALYLGWEDVEVYRYGVSPNKIFDYMMAGKPVLESGGAEVGIIDKAKCGIRCAASDPDAIAAAICKLFDTPLDERIDMGKRGQCMVRTHFDYRVLAKEYAKLF